MRARHVCVVGFSFFALAGTGMAAGTGAVATAAITPTNALPTTPYPVGEKFTFEATAIGFLPIGSVWMEITTGTFENMPTYVFNGRCLGDFTFYLADVRLSAHLSAATDRSLFHFVEQFGTERRGRRLFFDWASNTVRYIRLERDNKTYKLRRTTAVSNDVYDVYGIAFHARRLFTNMAVGASVEVKLIETERVFHVKATVIERRPLTIPGIGTFDAARIGFEALNLKPNEVFKGLLSLDKDIQVWVDSSTRTPLYLCSKVPFGFLRPTVEVILKEWTRVPGFEPTLLTTNTFLPRAFEGPKEQK